MFEIILHYVLLVIAVERVTEIITTSEIFAPIRMCIKNVAYKDDEPPVTFIRKLFTYFDKLINCGYCTSVWVAFIFAIAFLPRDWTLVINGFALHGLANLYHASYELVRRGRVNTHDVLLKHDMRTTEVNNDG